MERQLNFDSPDIDIPVNVVMTVYHGAAPSEVESSVTKPNEDAVSGMEGIGIAQRIESPQSNGIARHLPCSNQNARFLIRDKKMERKL